MLTITKSDLPHRNHESYKEIIQLRNRSQGKENFSTKPQGLWYGFGDSWLGWQQNADADFVEVPDKAIIYDLKINAFATFAEPANTKKVLVLSTETESDQFYSKYKTTMGEVFGIPGLRDIGLSEYINWHHVANDYAGIEIPTIDRYPNGIQRYRRLSENYDSALPNHRFMHHWDVPSGCIWDISVVESFSQFYPK